MVLSMLFLLVMLLFGFLTAGFGFGFGLLAFTFSPFTLFSFLFLVLCSRSLVTSGGLEWWLRNEKAPLSRQTVYNRVVLKLGRITIRGGLLGIESA